MEHHLQKAYGECYTLQDFWEPGSPKVPQARPLPNLTSLNQMANCLEDALSRKELNMKQLNRDIQVGFGRHSSVEEAQANSWFEV